LIKFPNPNKETWTLFAHSVTGDAHRDKAGAFSYRQSTLYGQNLICLYKQPVRTAQ